MKVALIRLIQELKHPAPAGHPENAERMVHAVEQVLNSDIASGLEMLTPTIVKTDCIFDIHKKEYLDNVKAISDSGGSYLDGDTYAGSQAYNAAWETASAAIFAAESIMNNQYRRIFLAGRPPGHHAEFDHGMGFCIINNIAVAAEVLIKDFNLKRVAIIDWDVHHGNGTQNAFYSRSDVLYVSLHQYPFYPGSGATAERGTGDGQGYTLNIPLPVGSGDDIYLQKFDEIIIPNLEDYKPEFILISCGFDAHRNDRLGGMELSEQAFGTMTSQLVDIAEKYSEGRILSLFEGGYTPAANAASLYYHLKELQKD
jgi:acetoin utilization deacetylase AcuC-like enzyme